MLKPVKPEIIIAQARSILEEQAIDQRKSEIREQIQALQAELALLDSKKSIPAQEQNEGPFSVDERYFNQGRLVFDLLAKQAIYADEDLGLAPTTFGYLLVLARHMPNLVDYQTLVLEAQEYQTDYQDAKELAKWHVHVIRQALADKPSLYVVNERGVGYRLLSD